MINYYSILGLGLQASNDEIKMAYKKVALFYHPDKNKNLDATSKFIEATEAFEVLKDSQKRKEYDLLYSKNVFNQQMSINNVGEDTSFKIWNEDAREQAKKYASYSFEEFSQVFSDEVKVIVPFLPRIFWILVSGFGAIAAIISLPELLDKKDGSSIAVFLVLGGCLFGFIFWGMSKTVVADYKGERKKLKDE